MKIMNNKDIANIKQSLINNMASADNLIYGDADKGVKPKYKGYTKDDLLNQLNELEEKHDKLVNVLTKQISEYTLKQKSPKFIIEENQLNAGFYKFELYCKENNIIDAEMSNELIKWVSNPILEYVITTDNQNSAYISLKKIIFERFLKTISKLEYRSKKQLPFQSIEEYINTMIYLGNTIKEDSESILITIKTNLQNVYRNSFNVALSKNIGSLLEICKLIEANNKRLKTNMNQELTYDTVECHFCKQKGHIKRNCKKLALNEENMNISINGL